MTHFLITFRETLEIALVLGIIWGYLMKTGQTVYRKSVVAGVSLGVIVSVAGVWLFALFSGGFEGRGAALFKGIIMLAGALFFTAMIFWMIRQRNIAAELDESAELRITGRQDLYLLILISLVVLRQVIDTVVFLEISTRLYKEPALIPGLAGVAVALIGGFIFYWAIMNLNLRKFLSFTTVVIILFAAGFVANGVNELQTAGVIPVIAAQVWDINPEVINGSYPLFHEDGKVGLVLKGLFGYNGDPNFLEIIAYLVYLAGITFAWRVITKRS